MNFIKTFIFAAFALSVVVGRAEIQKIDLKPSQDESRLLENPDKGWYHHYYDNSLGIYKGADADIERVPNLHHLFLRFAWGFLEPEEGKFNWALIDDQVEKWWKKGVKISLSITAQETGKQYATPQWVVEAGAKGNMYVPYPNSKEVFEPDYSDPIFLEKLSNLQKAIAKRYDGKPFIATITIASIGNWGEGHTSFTSKAKVSVETIKKHIDIYTKYFKKSQIVIGDDYLAARHTPEEIDELREYVRARKIGYRDDSILVHWTYTHNPSKISLLNPSFFDDAGEYAPATLEMDHYGHMKKDGMWQGKNGSKFGADVVRKVIMRAQCTYLGYHGYAKEFMDDNPEYALEMANRVGYWFFIDSVSYDSLAGTLDVEWNNRGAARAYRPYRVYFKIKSGDFEKVVRVKEADPRKFLSGITRETYSPDFSDAPKGKAELWVKMKSDTKPARTIELGFKKQLRDSDGFYKLGEIEIK